MNMDTVVVRCLLLFLTISFTQLSPTRAFTPTSFRSLKCGILPRRNHFHCETSNNRSGRQSVTSSSCRWSNNLWEWDGDDLRHWSRLRRRFRRSMSFGGQGRPIRNGIILVCILVAFYQTIDAVRWIVKQYPAHWPGNAPYMIWDVLIANASPGPFERDFGFHNKLARFQPHRYLTGGFLHKGILHLCLNINEIRRQPSWLETGLGGALYLTTFLVSIIAGCLGHVSWGRVNEQPVLLGATGGICGLYGLMFVSLARMGKQGASYKALIGLGIVMLYSILLDGVSNAAHLAAFLCGIGFGLIFGPKYSDSYAMRRKWSTYVDNEPKEYRAAMGFGTKAIKGGLLPLSVVWILGAIAMATIPKYRAIPATIARGILKPGSLSSFWW